MGLFDIIKDKAAELLGGASEKVNDLTGVDLQGGEVADQVAQSADNLTDTAQNVTDSAAEAADGAITDVTGPERPER